MNSNLIYPHNQKHSISLFFARLKMDIPLLGLITALSIVGLIILYSASNQSTPILMKQIIHLALGFAALITLAQIPPHQYQRWIPILFFLTLGLLVAVLIIGHVGKGAKRWLNLGIFHFQPSELMRLIIPMTIAWYLNDKPFPPSKKNLSITLGLIFITGLLIAKQPDLGTSIMVITGGLFVLFLAGLNGRFIALTSLFTLSLTPLIWHFMHAYQKGRVLTFINPERDPLGKGYHIIQSKIAIGSGGLFGKGWLAGTQSHLQFLPEHKTDFIFAVCGEEFGLLGCFVLLAILINITARGLYISLKANDTFSRLLAGSISLSFSLSFIINIGMVAGILPVVGIPLPLVSYGGTSIVMTLASFGLMISIHKHRKLISS